MNENVAKTVKEWFDQEGGSGLVLPDGLFGRPYDNVHELTLIAPLDEGLRIFLDENLLLYITGEVSVEKKPGKLMLADFIKLDFIWKEYGSTKEHKKSYDGGMVEFVSS